MAVIIIYLYFICICLRNNDGFENNEYGGVLLWRYILCAFLVGGGGGS